MTYRIDPVALHKVVRQVVGASQNGGQLIPRAIQLRSGRHEVAVRDGGHATSVAGIRVRSPLSRGVRQAVQETDWPVIVETCGPTMVAISAQHAAASRDVEAACGARASPLDETPM